MDALEAQAGLLGLQDHRDPHQVRPAVAAVAVAGSLRRQQPIDSQCRNTCAATPKCSPASPIVISNSAPLAFRST